jgi:SAM-dependent methyltransferase
VWIANAAAPAGFDRDAVGRLQTMERRDHFWLRHRRRLFGRLIDRLESNRDSALELGCGGGGMLTELEPRFRSVTAVDGYRELLALARERTHHATLIQADICGSPLADQQFDLIAAFDVIEHTDPDRLLREARRLVRPNGHLLLSAPAFPSLWSAMDERAGHRCRYRWRRLRAELERNGWRPLGHTYFQCLLFPLLFVSRRLGGWAIDPERRPSPLVNRALGGVNRLELAVSARFRVPFGSSLVAWASAA